MASIDAPVAGSKPAAISNMVVRLNSQYIGRGPTKARTYLHEDVVTVVLQNTLTKGEHTLVDNDRRELVLSMRQAFHEAMQADLIAGLQEILGREVVALLSANRTNPDYAVETFILAPKVDRGALA